MSMKAMVMTDTGGPEVLEARELDVPAIKRPSDVRVRLKAAGVNPVDTKFRRGAYPIETFPVVLGCDGAGIVEAVGDSVIQFRPGDEVWFFHGGTGTAPGNYAEYTVLDERFIARKPASIDFNQAAAAPLVLLTAWEALFDRAGLAPGKTVLVHAGAGGVGHVAIQLARHGEARVCTTISSPEKAEFARQLGAVFTINYREKDFAGEVLDWTAREGVDIVMDNVGGELIQASFPAVRCYGDLVTLLQPDNSTDWSVARQRNLRISLEVMLTPQLFGLVEAQKHQTWILEQCAALIDAGKLDIHVSHTLPLEQAAEAHRMIESGGTTGKIVLTIN